MIRRHVHWRNKDSHWCCRRFHYCALIASIGVFQQPQPIADIEWSPSTLREMVVKVGAKVISHGRYVTFQLAELAVPRELFRKILRLIDRLRPAPLPPLRRPNH